MLNRRQMLAGTTGFAVIGLALPAYAAGLTDFSKTALRGSLNATEVGIQSDTVDDQSKAFARLLAKAAETDAPVFLPPGSYRISNITLPKAIRITGVPGATRLVYGGDGHLLMAADAEQVDLVGLVLDGANRRIADYAQGIVDIRGAKRFVMDDCQVIGSGSNGLSLERVSGRIERSTISGAAEAGIYSVEAGRLSITGNSVTDCGNGGILVHRWKPADDFTQVTGNRVERIAARRGGTGQNGNGINAFRAAKVMIANNTVADCAFSAIRANSASDIQITGNNCSSSGETAIYSEFAFDGAAIANNIVDGAANGISVVNFNEGGRLATVSGNIVRNLSRIGPYPPDSPGFGIGIVAEADAALTGNVIEGAPLYGMLLGWGVYLRNITATGNVIRNAGTGVAVSVVPGAGATVVTDNVIDAAPNGAVVGYRWAEPVTGDIANREDSGFPHLTVGRNRVS